MTGFRLAPDYDLGTLQAELAGYRALLDVLDQEQDALRRADADALPALAAVKQREVQALSAFAAGRSRELAAARLPTTREAAQAYLVAAGALPDAVAAAWTELERRVGEAQRINAVNGALIDAQQSYFSRALAVLTTAAGDAPVYGANGRTQCAMGSRALGAI